jgi:hypothetical protein
MKQFRWYRMRLRTIVLAAFFSLAFGSVAPAQEQAAAPSDGDFTTFVMVNVELQKLAEEYQPVFDKAGGDASKRAALEEELQGKSKEVLTKNNLTPEAYREIFKTVNSDPQLRAKALQMIQQERQKR